MTEPTEYDWGARRRGGAMTALDRFRDALTTHNCNPRGTAARCPAHDDRQPSLSHSAQQKSSPVSW
jgi:hypothetical protein